jgi:hypothetical protein
MLKLHRPYFKSGGYEWNFQYLRKSTRRSVIYGFDAQDRGGLAGLVRGARAQLNLIEVASW